MDGIGTGDFLNHTTVASKAYFEREYTHGSKSVICGRPTFEEELPNLIDISKFKDAKVEKVDYIAPKKDDYYIIAIDSKGLINWTSGYCCFFGSYGGKTQKSQVITILTEQAKEDYLAYLKSIEVSYIFAGKDKVDLRLALKKLKQHFGIERILCEGGPTTNGVFLKENLVQKIILYKCPFIASPGGKPVFGNAKLEKWNLESFEMLSDKSSLILTYTKP